MLNGHVARFIDVNLNLMLDCPIGLAEQWKPLVLTTGDLPLFEERYGQATAENVIQFQLRQQLPQLYTFVPPSSLAKCSLRPRNHL